jgi:hypothetical protein
MQTALRDVRSPGQSGKHLLALSFSAFDPTRTKQAREAADERIVAAQAMLVA